MKLIEKKCTACEIGGTPLTAEQAQQLLHELTLPWELIGGTRIRHEFVFVDFSQSIQFINAVASLAESEGHHPDIHCFYNKVVIELWTHAVNGLSENDFILAAKIEKLV